MRSLRTRENPRSVSAPCGSAARCAVVERVCLLLIVGRSAAGSHTPTIHQNNCLISAIVLGVSLWRSRRTCGTTTTGSRCSRASSPTVCLPRLPSTSDAAVRAMLLSASLSLHATHGLVFSSFQSLLSPLPPLPPTPLSLLPPLRSPLLPHPSPLSFPRSLSLLSSRCCASRDTAQVDGLHQGHRRKHLASPTPFSPGVGHASVLTRDGAICHLSGLTSACVASEQGMYQSLEKADVLGVARAAFRDYQERLVRRARLWRTKHVPSQGVGDDRWGKRR